MCFERRCHKQNSVIRLKSNISSPTKFFVLPKLLGWTRYCLQGQVAKLITWQQILKCSLQVTILGVLSHVTFERRHLSR